jgi:hypothetical protein
MLLLVGRLVDVLVAPLATCGAESTRAPGCFTAGRTDADEDAVSLTPPAGFPDPAVPPKRLAGVAPRARIGPFAGLLSSGVSELVGFDDAARPTLEVRAGAPLVRPTEAVRLVDMTRSLYTAD